MQSITFDTQDVAMLGDNLHCRTPEALETALAKLREIGYEVKDLRLDEQHLKVTEATPRQMEEQGGILWLATLDTRRGKCGSCLQYIDTKGIMAHGRTCEHCGEVVYLDIPDGATVRFRFFDKPGTRSDYQLEMKVVHWDYEGGWLYFDPEPVLDSAGFCVAKTDKVVVDCLKAYSDKWEPTYCNGQLALKMRYVKQGGPEDRSDNAIDTYAVFHRYQNFTFVRVWDGVEYSEYGPDFPLPETLYIYELWHMANQPS